MLKSYRREVTTTNLQAEYLHWLSRQPYDFSELTEEDVALYSDEPSAISYLANKDQWEEAFEEWLKKKRNPDYKAKAQELKEQRDSYIERLEKNKDDEQALQGLIDLDAQFQKKSQVGAPLTFEYTSNTKGILDFMDETIKLEQAAATGQLGQSDPQTSRKLKDYRGLTAEEVNSLMDRSDLFRKFMEEGWDDYMLKTPKYKVLSPKTITDSEGNLDLNTMSKRASQEERNNMLIDTIWNTLTSPEGSVLSMLPGDFENIRKASRMQRILHDQSALRAFMSDSQSFKNSKGKMQALRDMVQEEGVYQAFINVLNDPKGRSYLEELYDKESSIDNPMDILSYSKNFKNLMDGNDLIGIFAVNSSNHYKLQFLNLKLAKKYQFQVKDPLTGEIKVVDTIDAVNSPINGMRIGRICAELQAAAPDNGKDPCLGDINANAATIARLELFARLGFDNITSGLLNNMDDLLKVGDAYGSTKEDLEDKKMFTLDIGRITNIYAKYKTQDPNEALDNKGAIKGVSKEDMEYLKAYCDWYQSMTGYREDTDPEDKKFCPAEALNGVQCMSRCDSPNGALAVTVPEALQQELKVSDYLKQMNDSRFPIEGLNKFINTEYDPFEGTNGRTSLSKEELDNLRDVLLDTVIPRMQAVYTLGHASARTLTSKYLTAVGKTMRDSIDRFRLITGRNLLYNSNVSDLRSFIQEYTLFLLTQKNNEFYKQNLAEDKRPEGWTLMDVRNWYLTTFPSVLQNFLTQRLANNKYRNKDIKDLAVMKRLSITSGKPIRIENVGRTMPLTRKQYMEGLDYIASFNDSKDLKRSKEVQELAYDLFMYAFFQNGLQFRHNSYSNMFSTRFLQRIPGYIEGLRQVEEQFKREGGINQTLQDRYITQYLAMHRRLIHHAYINSNGRSKISGVQDSYGEEHKAMVLQKGKDSQPGRLPDQFQPYPIMAVHNPQNQSQGDMGDKAIYYVNKPGTEQFIKLDNVPEESVYYDANNDAYDIPYNKVANYGDVRPLRKVDTDNRKNRFSDAVVEEESSIPASQMAEEEAPIDPTQGNDSSENTIDPQNMVEDDFNEATLSSQGSETSTDIYANQLGDTSDSIWGNYASDYTNTSTDLANAFNDGTADITRYGVENTNGIDVNQELNDTSDTPKNFEDLEKVNKDDEVCG